MTPLAIGIGALLVLWYVLGNELMRRRGRRLAVWCKRVADQFGDKQAIKWFTFHSFKLDVNNPKAPFRELSFTGLTESWDVPVIWLWNRLNWRRDMVLIQAALEKQPMFGCEIYRPRSVLAGDSRHAASSESWDFARSEEFEVAPASGPGFDLASSLLEVLGPDRARLIRLSVRRRETHFALSMNVPDIAAFSSERVRTLSAAIAAEVMGAEASARI